MRPCATDHPTAVAQERISQTGQMLTMLRPALPFPGIFICGSARVLSDIVLTEKLTMGDT